MSSGKEKSLGETKGLYASNFTIGHTHIPFHITSCGVLYQ